MVITKTREGAKVPSRKANYLEYTPRKDIIQGNKKPIGSTTLSQTVDGIWYPNIQSAIEDVSSMISVDLGEVLINTSGELPGPVQQITRATFSGVISTTDKSAIIEILGIPITVINGDDAAAVATKWSDKLKDYVNSDQLLNSINQDPATPHIIDLTHLDYQNHYFTQFRYMGIKVDFTVNSPAKSGYGSWYKLGQEDKTFGTEKYTLHYFRRIS